MTRAIAITILSLLGGALLGLFTVLMLCDDLPDDDQEMRE